MVVFVLSEKKKRKKRQTTDTVTQTCLFTSFWFLDESSRRSVEI